MELKEEELSTNYLKLLRVLDYKQSEIYHSHRKLVASLTPHVHMLCWASILAAFEEYGHVSEEILSGLQQDWKLMILEPELFIYIIVQFTKNLMCMFNELVFLEKDENLVNLSSTFGLKQLIRNYFGTIKDAKAFLARLAEAEGPISGVWVFLLQETLERMLAEAM